MKSYKPWEEVFPEFQVMPSLERVEGVREWTVACYSKVALESHDKTKVGYHSDSTVTTSYLKAIDLSKILKSMHIKILFILS